MDKPEVKLRRIPYPYKAILAICSDLDQTPNCDLYCQTTQFLNTTKATQMGQGLGLEIGNSIYFDMPGDQFSYWNTDDAGRAAIQRLIRSGHIDCIHSYGDLATTRAQAAKVLDELARHDCWLKVWTDHSLALSNCGADIMSGQGDLPESKAYHADLTSNYGVKYFWRGRVTSVIGQDVAPSLGGIFTLDHPVASARTVAREAAKQVLGRCANAKYTMHGANSVIRQAPLRDGNTVYEFIRSNPHWGGISSCDTGRGIGNVLTDPMLDRLAWREGVCILYTHLGKVHSARPAFDNHAVAGFRRLAQRQYDKRILVATTYRILRYLTVRNYLGYRTQRKNDKLTIIIESIDEPIGKSRQPTIDDLAGITFLAPANNHVEVKLSDGQTLACQTVQQESMTCVTIPWQRLEFPDL